MPAVKNIILTGAENKPIATDIFYLNTSEQKPVVIYAHGFNGFKDWGNFDLIASQFSSAGFVFVKFNFSHNGTTPEHPEEFVDLEAYGNNNYTKELYDLDRVIDWVCAANNPYAAHINSNKVYLVGHSRGGGIVLLKAAEDERVKAVTSWASVSKCRTPWGGWPSEKIKDWIDKGVTYITNSRTKQELPLYYQLFDDYQFNKERLDIETAVKGLKIPILICHGFADTSVDVEKAYQLNEWAPSSKLFLVESDHVFGRKHPWTGAVLPKPMQMVVEQTIDFFRAI
jgi:predicted dienelactone hydrolase